MASAAGRGSIVAIRRACQGGAGRVLPNNASPLCGISFGGKSGLVARPLDASLPVLAINGDTFLGSIRHLSSPPPGRKDMLRMHAVSLYDADYFDEDEEEDPKWKVDKGDQAYLDPRDGRKAEEDEEATWWLYDGTQESRDALASMREKEAQKKRWIQNARPPPRVSEIDERGRAYGRGTRKTAKARVWVQPGEGEIVVNRKDFLSYFPRESDRDHVLGPFVASQTCGKFDVTAVVNGGGLRGQAGAIRLGLARALEKYNPDYRPPMKRHGFMTRDPRMVERKKVGRVKARKSPQWVRR